MDEVEAVGARAHEMLVKLRGTKSYTKETTDEAWIVSHGTNQVDLAALTYDQLPLDWKFERDAGARIAVTAIRNAMMEGRAMDNGFIEEVSKELHDKWLERNSHRAGEAQKLEYVDLPESEKEKDRCFVHAAIEVASHESKAT